MAAGDRSIIAFRFQSQEILTRGFIVRKPALSMLGNYMDVLKLALNWIGFKYGVAATQIVGQVDHLGGHTDGMGSGKPQVNPLLRG